MYKRLSDVKMQLDELRERGVELGKGVGWSWSNFPFTIKEGCTTYIAAAPASGKTEFWFELLINLSCIHGWKHAVFSPETGEAKDIFSELCHKYIGKRFIKGENCMSEAERTRAEYFINEHFFVIDPQDEDLTVASFYDIVDKMEIDLKIRINTTTIDPWNELTERLEPTDMGREDKYLSRVLGIVRKNARKTMRHNCILNHVRDQAAITSEGITYYPMPTARDFAGGQVWFRKGLSVLIPWRPPYGLSDNNGIPYKENELLVRVAKSKPKGTSKLGVYRFCLNTSSYQYYIEDITGQEIYANRMDHKPTMKPPDKVEQVQMNGFAHSDFDKPKSNYEPDPSCGF